MPEAAVLGGTRRLCRGDEVDMPEAAVLAGTRRLCRAGRLLPRAMPAMPRPVSLSPRAESRRATLPPALRSSRVCATASARGG